MKTTIEVSQEYNAVFIPVARIIADPPPEWLMVGLEHFSGFVGGGRSTSDEDKRSTKIFGRMHDAADLLIKYLPLYSSMPSGLSIPDDVIIALDVLPRIKKDLARVVNRKPRGGGQRPNVRRQFCAAVVVEACKLLHEKMPPKETLIANACNEYWQACGGEYRGDDYAEAWRRDVEQAINDNKQEWIRDLLIGVRNSHTNA
jgi:hypothetical protein